MSLLNREVLNQTLSSLPSPQFGQLVFALNHPKGILPAETAPQADRANALLAWAESTGPGLRVVQEKLYEILGKELPVPEGVCPYKGLSYFDCNDRDYRYFFGRQALTHALLEKVAREDMVAIAGASGSGKSSVLRAGLLQQLRDQGGYEIRILVPGDRPLQNLALAFVDETADRLDRAEQQQKATRLIETGAEGLIALVQTSPAQRVVLAIDQFEEAFTLCHDDAERHAFFATLMAALAALPSNLCLILAMRSDFVGKCLEQDYGGLADHVQAHLFSVRPMTAAELTEAITAPARQVGLSLEPGLAKTLLRDVDQSPSGLPLLQYALTELWQRQQDHQLKLATYAQLGGVTGTLQRRADAVYDSLSSDQQNTARHIFLNLTQLGEGSEDTRRRVRQKDLVSAQHPAEQVAAVVKQLADANLVVTDEQVGVDGEREAIVDVTHEALIRHWPKLHGWLDKSRLSLYQKRKIEREAQEWEKQGKIKEYLLQGRPLQDAKKWIRDNQKSQEETLLPLALEFIYKSHRDNQKKQVAKVSLLLVFPLIGTLVLTHFQILNQANLILSSNECKPDTGIKLILRYMWLSGYADDFRRINLCGENLVNLNLPEATMPKTNFRDANLANSNFRNALIAESNFKGAVLAYSNFSKAFLIAADFRCSERQCSDLTGADFSGSMLDSANFEGAFLEKVNFRRAILSNANFTNSKGLELVSLEGATLCNTILPPDINLPGNRNCQP